MSARKSEWFGPEQKPWEPGWYETGRNIDDPRHGGRISPYRWWWDGKLWRTFPKKAAVHTQHRVWRGLASPRATK